MPYLTRCLLPLLLLALPGLLGCGSPEDEEIDPTERCEVDGLKSYLEGHLSNEERQNFQLQVDDDANGFIGYNEIRVVVGQGTPPGDDRSRPVILRLYDPQSTRNLIHRLSELTEEGPIVLDVFDASEPPAGSQGRASLSGYDCSLDDGNICVQLGFDRVGDTALTDNDTHAYNGASGTVQIDIADRQVKVQLDAEFGRNVLGFEDQTSGAFTGCISPRYQVSSDDAWPLS